MMALIWRDAMSVGNNIIDADHRYLICYVNTVELALQKPDEKEVLMSALSQLYDYAYEHFMREERIQQKISYPEFNKHRQEHKELLEQLLELRNKINSHYSEADIDKHYSEIVSFLRHWIIDHVLNTDRLLIPYLSKFTKNFAG